MGKYILFHSEENMLNFSMPSLPDIVIFWTIALFPDDNKSPTNLSDTRVKMAAMT
jgi:hypothetical protein